MQKKSYSSSYLTFFRAYVPSLKSILMTRLSFGQGFFFIGLYAWILQPNGLVYVFINKFHVIWYSDMVQENEKKLGNKDFSLYALHEQKWISMQCYNQAIIWRWLNLKAHRKWTEIIFQKIKNSNSATVSLMGLRVWTKWVEIENLVAFKKYVIYLLNVDILLSTNL